MDDDVAAIGIGIIRQALVRGGDLVRAVGAPAVGEAGGRHGTHHRRPRHAVRGAGRRRRVEQRPEPRRVARPVIQPGNAR